MNKSHKFNKSGFTLIELLVVVLIIGILSSVALPQYTKSVEKARASQAMIYMDAYVKAQQLYKLANDSYASTTSVLSESTGIELPTVDSDQWSVLKTVVFGGTNRPNIILQRKISEDKQYGLKVDFVTNASGESEILRYCYGNEKMCKAIGGGKTCTENGSVSDPAWCYSSKSSIR